MINWQTILDTHKIDAVLLCGGANIRYATGYLADFAYVLILPTAKYYITDSRFKIEAKEKLSSEYKIIITKGSEAVMSIFNILEGSKAKKIGMDTDIAFYQYREISLGLRHISIVDITDKILAARAIKSQDEIGNICTAQAIAEGALTATLPKLRTGISEREIAAELEYAMKMGGSEGVAFDTIVAFGSNSAHCHAKPCDRQLQIGDIILFDFGAKHNGYCSDMTRTFVYGHATEQITKMYNSVLLAKNESIKAIKENVSGRAVEEVARKVLQEASLEQYFAHSLGHSVGIDIHEKPTLSMGDNTLLQPNVIMTVEPGVYIEGLGGIRIEDMVCVGIDDCTNLTTFDDSLTIIPIKDKQNVD